MKNKFLLTAVVMLQLLVFHCSAYADYPIGDIYVTDTTAYIDANIIPVYVYNDYPYVVAEDLEGYGFDIRWNANERVLDLYYNPNKPFNPYDDAAMSTGYTYAGTVYSDSNRVRLNGEFVTSYSLSGRMLISLDELWRIGAVNWYDESKTISVTSRAFMQAYPDWDYIIRSTSLAEKIDEYVECALKTYSDMVDEYNAYYIGQPYSTMVYIDEAYRNEYLLIADKVYSCYSYITENEYLLKSDIASQMGYYAILLQEDLINMYDNINGHTVEFVDTNMDTIESLANENFDNYMYYCEAYAE